MDIYENLTFVSRYPMELKLYEKAKRRLAEGEADDTLFTARKSLEFFLKDFSEKCGLEAADNHIMIDNLKACGLFSEDEVSVLHRLRLLGNTGGHGTGTMAQARECMELLEQAIEIFMAHDDESAFAAAAASGGDLTTDPMYYAPRRKYRGKWAFSYTRTDLFSIPEYSALHRQAEQGDISAMLDLAIGFLPATPVWGVDQTVCMPKCRAYYNDELDAFDARYYYWLTQACSQAAENAAAGKPYPKKYMATALFDAMKFALHWSNPMGGCGYYVSEVHGHELTYANQFELAEELFGSYVYTDDFCRWTRLLLQLVRQAGTFDVVDRVHTARYQEDEIRYLAYCYCYLNADWLPGDLSLDEECDEMPVSFERLTACKPANGSCDVYYAFAEKQIKLLQAEKEKEARKEQQEKEQKKNSRRGCLRSLLGAILWVGFFVAIFTVPSYLNKLNKEPLDPFASVVVTFEGVEPYGTAYLDTSANPDLLDSVHYTISEDNMLSNGDTVTVKAVDRNDKLLARGYALTATKKKYTVSGLAESVSDPTTLDDTSLEQLTAQALTMVTEELQSTGSDILCNWLVDDRLVCLGNMDYSKTVGEVTSTSAHFLQGKRLSRQENKHINQLVLFFEAPVLIERHGEEIWYDDLAYYAVQVLDLPQDDNGQPVIDLSNAHISDPYASYQDIYDEYVRQYLDTYEATELK